MARSDRHIRAERVLPGSRYEIWWHLLLAVGVILITWWELRDIYQPDTLLFPVLKTSLITLGVIYLNVYVLVPRLVFRRWYWVYLLVVVYVVVAVYLVESWSNDIMPIKYGDKIRELIGKIDVSPMLIIGTSIFSMVMLIIGSSVVVLFHRWTRLESQVNQLREAKISVEVASYKQQINHDAVCGILRSIRGRIGSDPDGASSMISRLGGLLRYQLYDCARDLTLLTADLKHLRDFLDMRTECNEGFGYDMACRGDFTGIVTPPLMMYSIANCFCPSGHLDISIAVDDAGLRFERRGVLGGTGCEGLADVARRLELIYGDRYSVEQWQENEYGRVVLMLPARLNDGE